MDDYFTIPQTYNMQQRLPYIGLNKLREALQ